MYTTLQTMAHTNCPSTQLSCIVGMGKSGLMPPEQLILLKAAIKLGTLGAGQFAFVCFHAVFVHRIVLCIGYDWGRARLMN
jgi:hypothetical protein